MFRNEQRAVTYLCRFGRTDKFGTLRRIAKPTKCRNDSGAEIAQLQSVNVAPIQHRIVQPLALDRPGAPGDTFNALINSLLGEFSPSPSKELDGGTTANAHTLSHDQSAAADTKGSGDVIHPADSPDKQKAKADLSGPQGGTIASDVYASLNTQAVQFTQVRSGLSQSSGASIAPPAWSFGHISKKNPENTTTISADIPQLIPGDPTPGTPVELTESRVIQNTSTADGRPRLLKRAGKSEVPSLGTAPRTSPQSLNQALELLPLTTVRETPTQAALPHSAAPSAPSKVTPTGRVAPPPLPVLSNTQDLALPTASSFRAATVRQPEISKSAAEPLLVRPGANVPSHESATVSGAPAGSQETGLTFRTNDGAVNADGSSWTEPAKMALAIQLRPADQDNTDPNGLKADAAPTVRIISLPVVGRPPAYGPTQIGSTTMADREQASTKATSAADTKTGAEPNDQNLQGGPKSDPPSLPSRIEASSSAQVLAPANSTTAAAGNPKLAPDVAGRRTETSKVESKSEINMPGQAQPARAISLRMSAPESGDVDVKFFQRAGRVQVSIRTPDSGLTETLQAGAIDLVSRLERRGFAAETWTPKQVSPQSSNQDPFPSNAHTGNDASYSGSGGGSGQQEQQKRSRPQWVSELENDFHFTEEEETA